MDRPVNPAQFSFYTEKYTGQVNLTGQEEKDWGGGHQEEWGPQARNRRGAGIPVGDSRGSLGIKS